jgi:hypothetical protein
MSYLFTGSNSNAHSRALESVHKRTRAFAVCIKIAHQLHSRPKDTPIDYHSAFSFNNDHFALSPVSAQIIAMWRKTQCSGPHHLFAWARPKRQLEPDARTPFLNWCFLSSNVRKYNLQYPFSRYWHECTRSARLFWLSWAKEPMLKNRKQPDFFSGWNLIRQSTSWVSSGRYRH